MLTPEYPQDYPHDHLGRPIFPKGYEPNSLNGLREVGTHKPTQIYLRGKDIVVVLPAGIPPHHFGSDVKEIIRPANEEAPDATQGVIFKDRVPVYIKVRDHMIPSELRDHKHDYFANIEE